MMNEQAYPKSTHELAELRRRLAPDAEAAFQAFSKSVFIDGALSSKIKQLIAVAVAHVMQCPFASPAIQKRRCGQEHHRKN